MATIAEELSLLPFFAKVPRHELDRAAPLFRREKFDTNELVWAQGAAVDELAIVLLGELVAHANLREVGRIRAPDLIGEAGAFVAGSIRTASVKAARPTEVLTLSVPDLRTLRFAKSRVYDALLEQAQRSLCRRIAATNARVAQVAQGATAAVARREPGALVRLWRTLRPGLPSTPCPPVGPILRELPGLRHMEPELEELLAQGFAAEPFEEGRVLVLEGEVGSSMYLVAQGDIDVLRNVRGDRAELLVRLGAGQQFGANTLVDPAPRTASCVAATAGWLYRMDKDAFLGLRGDARTAWRECVLATLATQLKSANAALDRALVAGGVAAAPGAPEGGFDELLRASGYLESLPRNESDLAELSFVVTDDHERNRRRPKP